MKHKIEFIIKSNEFLAENKIKNEIEQLLLKYKHGNDIHEQKTAKRISHINLLLTCHKNHETLSTTPPIHVYINRINNGLVLKIKHGSKLELQTPETMKLFCSTKKLIDKTKNGEKVISLEVVEVVLVQCNLVDNQYQQKSEVLHTFTPNKYYVYLLIVEPSNLVFLKTYNRI